MTRRFENTAENSRPSRKLADRRGIRAPATIVPTMIMSVVDATALLGLPANCLPREIRKRRLRASRRGGCYWLLGQWLLDWIAGGEISQERHVDDSPDRPT